MDRLRSRIRAWTLFFICGLFISGATALPIRTEVAVAARILGEDFRPSGSMPPPVAAWLGVLRDAVETTARQAPLMFYGTDWLPFRPFMIGPALISAGRDALRHRYM